MKKHKVDSAISKINFKSSQKSLRSDIRNDVNFSYSFHPDLDDTQSAIEIVDYLRKENERIVELLKIFAP